MAQIKLTDEQLELASKLTTFQRKFVLELIKTGTSQRQAYLAAGGTAKSEQSQDSCATTMFSNTKVREFYDSLFASIASESIMTKQEALERLSKTARATIHDICTFKLVEVPTKDSDGNEKIEYNTIWTMKHTDEIDPVIAASIKSVTFTKTGPKIEMYDANGSIKLLSDLQGWNAPKKQEITGKDGGQLSIKTDVSSPEIVSALASLMAKL
jgi:phage terminase small subunit